MTEKILHCDWLRTGQLIVNREREIKHDVTAKIKLLPSVNGWLYSRLKIFVFAVNSRRQSSIFVAFN